MKSYILIEAVVGKATQVAKDVRTLNLRDASLLSADVVTGPFDVIVVLESADFDALMNFVSEQIQKIDGVQHTVTCVA